MDVPAGPQTLTFSLVGYQRVTRTGVAVEGEKETVVNVTMTQTPIQTEQIVVTASKREQSLEEVPVSVSVLEAVDIQRRNSLTIDEALRYVPGVNITGTQVNIRGSSGYSLGAGSRVLLLLDGVPFIAGDTGELNFESIPMGQVDRIEVVKGASSALYGSNALGGVINVITKPIPDGAETDVRAYGGFYSEYPAAQWRWSSTTRFFEGQSVTHSHREGDLGISLFLSHQADDGYRANDYRQRYNLFAKLREDLSASRSLTLSFGLASQHAGQFLYWRNIDSATLPPVRHVSDDMISTRYYLNGLYNDALSDHLLFTAKLLWYHNGWGFEATGDAARTQSLDDGFRLEVLSTLLAGEVQTLTFGVDGNIDLIGGDAFESRSIGGLALFAQDEVRLPEHFTLTLGGRFDFQTVGLTGEGAQLNPKVALTWNPVQGTTLRASYGRGFRVPSLPEAFISAGSTGLMAVPNMELKPERSNSYEAGLSQKLWEAGTLDLAVFRSDIDNLIEPGLIVAGQDLEVQWRNVTRARVQGFETGVRAGVLDNLLVANFGYTYVYPQDLTLHDILKYRPRHVLYANGTAHAGMFTGSVDFRFVSRIDRIDDELVNAGVVPDGDQRVPIYVTDIRLGADFVLGGVPVNATLSVNNAFQHRYVELIGNIMAPRNYVLVLAAHW
jgi:iron complex outermembrane receptor protein